MIFKRKKNIQDVFERYDAEKRGDEAKYEFAECGDGDQFYDDFGNLYYISMSGGGSINSVLNGEAHNENIEPLPKWVIFEHFKNDKIMRWCDSLAGVSGHIFDYWDSQEDRWIRVEEMAVNAHNVYCQTSWGDDVYLPHDAIIKVRE